MSMIFDWKFAVFMAIQLLVLYIFALVMLKTRDKKQMPSNNQIVDRLAYLIGTDTIEIFNGVTYSGTRNDQDGCDQPLKFNTDKWFKIRIGKYISGPGDWGGGFDYASCAVAEVYIDYSGFVLHVCAPEPFYNSRTKEADNKLHEKVQAEIDKFKFHMSCHDNVRLETGDPWLRGVLDTFQKVVFIGEADLWKHPITIEKRSAT